MTTGYNMQLPPPNVSGVVIPGGLAVKKSSNDFYSKQLEIRRIAQKNYAAKNKQFQFKDKEKTPRAVKFLLAAGALVGAFFGAKHLIKHFKK